MDEILSGGLGQMLPKLTDKQLSCLLSIAEFYTVNRFYPSRRELAGILGVSTSSASQHINFLIKKEYLVVEVGERRNIRLTDKALERIKIEKDRRDTEQAT